MKFRTDFVTNSSSSCFLDCWLEFTEESMADILILEEDPGEISGIPLIQEDDGVYYRDFKIKTFDELLACLYFFYIEESSCSPELNQVTVPIIVSAFCL